MADLPCKIIICCDGTSNSEYIENNKITNVTRISRYISQFDPDGIRQLVFYLRGIGTNDDTAFITNLVSQATGGGIVARLLEAYSFICHNYSSESDELFLVGYSRGAFTARCLADFLSRYGVLSKTQLPEVHRLLKHWQSASRTSEPPIRGKEVTIKACALWDTVGSVGYPAFNTTYWRELGFVHSNIECASENIFQALALHEHRCHFFPIVLRKGERPCNFVQCWFPGYHGEVGGGGGSNNMLAHFPLIWIMSKLSEWIKFDLDDLVDPGPFNDTGSASDKSKLEDLADARISVAGGVARLFVKDPKTRFYRATLSLYRGPLTSFWDEKAVYENDDLGVISNERMHISSRLFTTSKLIKEFPSVQGVEHSQPQRQASGKWQWSLRKKAWSESWPQYLRIQKVVDPGEVKIMEEEPNDWEKSVLRAWAYNACRRLGAETFPTGDETPTGTIFPTEEESQTTAISATQTEEEQVWTIFPELLRWLEDPLREVGPPSAG